MEGESIVPANRSDRVVVRVGGIYDVLSGCKGLTERESQRERERERSCRLHGSTNIRVGI